MVSHNLSNVFFDKPIQLRCMGRYRDPDTWKYIDFNTFAYYKIYRGYTGHEMLPQFGLINMNGRMYDPVVGRFLSPDNVVQDPSNSQIITGTVIVLTIR